VQHWVNVAYLGLPHDLLHLLVSLPKPLVAKLAVLVDQQLTPRLARVIHSQKCIGLLVLAESFHLVMVLRDFGVDQEANVAAALTTRLLQDALDHTCTTQQLRRELVGSEGLGEDNKDGSSLLDALVRLLLARRVHVREARKVDEAVAALENGGRKKDLDAFHHHALQVVLRVDLSELLPNVRAVEMDRFSAPEVELEALVQNLLERIAHRHFVRRLWQLLNRRNIALKSAGRHASAEIAGGKGVVEAPHAEELLPLIFRQPFGVAIQDDELVRSRLGLLERVELDEQVRDPAVARARVQHRCCSAFPSSWKHAVV